MKDEKKAAPEVEAAEPTTPPPAQRRATTIGASPRQSTIEYACAEAGLELSDIKTYVESGGDSAVIVTHRGQTHSINIGRKVEREIEAALHANNVKPADVRSIQRDLIKGEALVYVRGRALPITVEIAKPKK